MKVDFNGSAQSILLDIKALMADHPLGRQCILGDENIDSEKSTLTAHFADGAFMHHWIALMVYVRDLHHFKIDLGTAVKWLDWQRLDELCNLRTIVGKSAPAQRMYQHLHSGQFGALHDGTSRLMFEDKGVACILQAALASPIFPPSNP